MRCHYCGAWWRQLASHAFHSHGLTGAEYRRQVGLKPRERLCASSLSATREEQMRRRMQTDPAIVVGMQRGTALARSGALQAKAREVAPEHRGRQAPAAQLVASGRRLGAARAETYRDARDARAKALGFEDLRDYLRRRYVVDGARIEDLQRELGASYAAVRADLRRAGINVRRGKRPSARR